MSTEPMQERMLVVAPYACRVTDGGPQGFIAQNILSYPGNDIQVSQKSVANVKRTLFEKLTSRMELYRETDRGTRFSHPDCFYSDWRKYRAYLRANAYQSYKYLYFHDLAVLGLCSDMLLEGQVILIQPHAPEILSIELRRGWADRLDDKMLSEIDNLCKSAFEVAHHIILPHEGALAIYQSQISDVQKVRYLLSASQDYSLSQNTAIALDREQINFLYVGRRNAIKGFDLVLGAFREAHQRRKNIHLYVVGNGDPIQGAGITDVGFSTHPALWMRSVDFILNANRCSYFDLSVMEALSVGTRMALTTTFGHHFFKSFVDDINLIEISAEKDSIEAFLLNAKKPGSAVSDKNRKIYETYFSPEKYHERLAALMSDLCTQ